jgi:hypothetical protein
MEEASMYTVRATDGEAKRWMWNSEWFDLPEGGERVLPSGPALQGVAFYTIRDANGGQTSTVTAEPYEGEVELQPVTSPHRRGQFADEDGTEYGSLAELIAAVKARAASGETVEDPAKSS